MLTNFNERAMEVNFPFFVSTSANAAVAGTVARPAAAGPDPPGDPLQRPARAVPLPRHQGPSRPRTTEPQLKLLPHAEPASPRSIPAAMNLKTKQTKKLYRINFHLK
jgi:hypothetical protein